LDIKAEDIGKKYGRNWVFRHLNFEIKFGSKVAITGSNGSGKSTLLQIIGGYLTPSRGKVSYDSIESLENSNVVFVSPYSELIEEFTLREFLSFHSNFRSPTLPFEEMAKRASLPIHQSIGDFSTGMKQRVKLLTAFFFENELILFDEPTSNLDEEGFHWWKVETNQISNRTVIIASNQKDEINLCQQSIDL